MREQSPLVTPLCRSSPLLPAVTINPKQIADELEASAAAPLAAGGGAGSAATAAPSEEDSESAEAPRGKAAPKAPAAFGGAALAERPSNVAAAMH